MPTPTTPTHAQMLALVMKRVPHFAADRQSTIASEALVVLTEPRHKDHPHTHAVKMAVARSYRHPSH